MQTSSSRQTFEKDAIGILLNELKICGSTGNLQRGREIHRQAMECGNGSCIFIATSLVKMYAKCKSMAEAHQVFDSIMQPDVVSWTALILGYADNGEGMTALDLFARMRSQGCVPDSFTFVAALTACTSLVNEKGRDECLKWGKKIHSQINCRLDMYMQSTLINMYAKCGSMIDARQVFDTLMHPNVVAWTALILGYAENGEGPTSLYLFSKMRDQGCKPGSLTFVAALKACTSLALDQNGKQQCLKWGKEIHSQIGFHSSYVQNTLVNMYAKCGSMTEARQVFDSMKQKNVVSWNAIILGYAENGEGIAAMELFHTMRFQGYAPDSFTFVAALKACTSLRARNECLLQGKEIHSRIGSHSDMYVECALISMYAKCGSMIDARHVFDSMEHPNVVSWSALILGYAEQGEGDIALDMFARMKSQGCLPNSLTFVAALKACGLLGALERGRQIHAEMDIKKQHNVILVNNLVDFYAKCGSMVEAQDVFDMNAEKRDLITWNALLGGYSRMGNNKLVFRLLEQMHDAGFMPDGVTFSCVLKCCSHAGLVDECTEYLEAMSKNYGLVPSLEHYTCLIDVLGRSNKLDDAIALLQRMPCRPDSITWMAVLGASHKWKNVETGRLAFKSLIDLDYTNGAAYVLMADIYNSKGMWKEQEMLLAMRRKELKVWKDTAQACWTSENGKVHTFFQNASSEDVLP